MSKTESIEQQAYGVLNKCFLGWREVPASISGRFHGNESMETHIKHTVSVTKHLCDCYDIKDGDRDLMIAAAILHDMGKFVISTPSKILMKGWKYYPQTDYSRIEGLYKIHGPVGAAVLDDHKIDRQEELKGIISSHMHRFSPDAPQPVTLFQHIICLADYIATRELSELLNYKEPEKNSAKE